MKRRSGLAGLLFYGLSLGLTVVLLYPKVSSANKRVFAGTCSRSTTGAISWGDWIAATSAPATVTCPLELDESTQVHTVRTIWIDGYDNSSSTAVQAKVCLLKADAALIRCSVTRTSGNPATGHFTIEYKSGLSPEPWELPGWDNPIGSVDTALISVTFGASGDKMFGFTLLQ